jgi:hypothetical protein
MKAQLQQAFEKLKGLTLTKTTRNDLVQYFHFGNTHYTTPQGLILDVGLLVLVVNCPWQLQQNDEATIKHSEVFMRKREVGLPSAKFDWKVPGANLRDQRLKELIHRNTALSVKETLLQENNGFILRFTDNSQLVVSPDPGKNQETDWQLFSNTDDKFSITAGISGIV